MTVSSKIKVRRAVVPYHMWLSRKKIYRDAKSRLHGQHDRPADKAIKPAKDGSPPWENGT